MSRSKCIGLAAAPIVCAAMTMMISPGGATAAEVWISNMKSGNVQVIDPRSMRIVATIPAGKGAHNVTISRDGKLALVPNVGDNSVTIIDAETKSVLGTVPVGKKAYRSSGSRTDRS